MKLRILYLLSIIIMTSSLLAGNQTEVGKITRPQGSFLLKKEKANGKTILVVEVSQSAMPVWIKTLADFPDGGNLLDYWQIIDGYVQGNDVSFLIGMDRGILWVKVSKINDAWTIAFAQELYGAASRQLKTKSIAIRDANSIEVVDNDGVASIFSRSSKGDLFKDGVIFRNAPSAVIENP
jgi:hypothetical protein